MSNTSTKKDAVPKAPLYPSQVRLEEVLALRSMSHATREEYRRYVLRFAQHKKCDPESLDEPAVRAYLLYLRDVRNYSASTMRGACASLKFYYQHVLGRDYRLFDLVRWPDRKKLPSVLSREEVAKLFNAVHEARFRIVFRVIYSCGLRISEAVKLEVGDIRNGGRCLLIRQGKGDKDRMVPLPASVLRELRQWWRTHRHPRFLFPAMGRGYSIGDETRLGLAIEPMSITSIQTCFRLALCEAGFAKGRACVHTLRHSYATHLLEEGVGLLQISRYLGHSTLDTTIVYTHLTAVSEERSCAVIDKLFA